MERLQSRGQERGGGEVLVCNVFSQDGRFSRLRIYHVGLKIAIRGAESKRVTYSGRRKDGAEQTPEQ